MKKTAKKDWKKGLTKKDISDFNRESKAWMKERSLVIKENLAEIKHSEFLINNFKQRMKVTKEGVIMGIRILNSFKKKYGYK